jgi:hypothetical protein
VKVP